MLHKLMKIQLCERKFAKLYTHQIFPLYGVYILLQIDTLIIIISYIHNNVTIKFRYIYQHLVYNIFLCVRVRMCEHTYVCTCVCVCVWCVFVRTAFTIIYIIMPAKYFLNTKSKLYVCRYTV